jgi:hypothetical protein
MWQSSVVRLHRVAVSCGSTVWQPSVTPPFGSRDKTPRSDFSVWQSSVVGLHRVSVLCGEAPLFGSLLWPDSTMRQSSMIILHPEWQSSVAGLHRVAVLFFLVRPHRVAVLCGQTPTCDRPPLPDSTVYQSSVVRLPMWQSSVISVQGVAGAVIRLHGVGTPCGEGTPRRNQLNIIQGPCTVGSHASLLKKQNKSYSAPRSSLIGNHIHKHPTLLTLGMTRVSQRRYPQLANSTYTVVDDRQSISDAFTPGNTASIDQRWTSKVLKLVGDFQPFFFCFTSVICF